MGLVLIGLSYLAVYSDFAKVKEIKVEGARITNEEVLLASLASEIIESDRWRALFGTDNLVFWLGAEPAEILKRMPLLADLKINTDLWQQKIKLEVGERKLEGVWCLAEDGCFVFDKDGIAFRNAPYLEGALILKIIDENKRAIQLGAPLLPDSSWFNNLLTAVKGIKDGELAAAEIKVKSLELREWEVKLPSGLVLKFSLEHVPADLSQVIGNLKNELDFSKLQYVDFRVPNRVYYK